MRKITALLVLGAVLAACQGFYLATPIPQTWIGILGPLGWTPPEELSLELGGSAWSITAESPHGVVTVFPGRPVEVTLWGALTCRRYALFEAPAGSLYRIVFLEDGSIRIDDLHGQAIEMGPSLPERAPTGCT